MPFWNRSDESDPYEAPGPETDWAANHPVVQSAADISDVFAPAAPLRPSLGRETSVTGRLSFSAPTRIDGKLRGEVRASDLLVVGEDGFVEGTVRAQKLLLLGEIRGDVHVTGQVEVAATGRLIGSVETHSLVVKEGAYLDGDCRIAPPVPTVEVLEPGNA